MFATGTKMFLLIPDASNARVLHPGNVIESNPQTFVAEFEEAISPQLGADVNTYAENRGKFFQQGAVIQEIRRLEPTPIVVFERVGEAVSAENRQVYRVSVAMNDIFATIGKEKKCHVVDMSPNGFGVVVGEEYAIGTLVEVTMQCEGQTIVTSARVQAVKELPNGKKRYGFLALQKNSEARKTLEKISSAIQRSQLRRLSGAA